MTYTLEQIERAFNLAYEDESDYSQEFPPDFLDMLRYLDSEEFAKREAIEAAKDAERNERYAAERKAYYATTRPVWGVYETSQAAMEGDNFIFGSDHWVVVQFMAKGDNGKFRYKLVARLSKDTPLPVPDHEGATLTAFEGEPT